MDTEGFLEIIVENAKSLSQMQMAILAGFVFVVYRCVSLNNYPLLESDPKPRETHKWRLITAAFYVPFVTMSAIFFPIVLKMFLSMMIYLGVEEYLQIVFQLRFKALKGKPDPKKLALTKKIQLAGLIVSLSAYPGNQLVFASVSYFAFIVLVSAFMQSFAKFDFESYFEALGTLSIFLLCLVWVFIPLSYGILMANFSDGGAYLTMLLTISWIGDAAAYYVGSRFGTHKFSQISPAKTLEGIFSEIFFCVCLASGYKYLEMNSYIPWMKLPHLPWLHYIAIGLLVGVFGVIGDLFESLVKRSGFAKDSGIFFPGHGGILDRFDSFLFITPAAYFYVLFVVKEGVLDGPIDWWSVFSIRGLGMTEL
eukprot:TRINITY_DN6003_c0_g1_i1.p1 TRINITY_DN6003_c0_g1~~TRINITY_DN6003_c0_g1_i1.p1  ORF type:complete len:366 (+),score=88.80 TRINITY_DN6003_c0_g1_i1:39-1136(+)